MIAVAVLLAGGSLFALLSAFVTGEAYWAAYWLYWFFGVFLVPELTWVFVNSNYTVSDETWRFESLNMANPYDFSQWTAIHWTFAVVYFVFMFLLGLHLIAGLGH